MIGCVLVGLVGVAGGIAVGLPGLVERAGERALHGLERRFGVQVTASEVDWTWDGTVVAKGVALRPVGAPDEAVFATAERVTVESEVAPWQRRVRVLRIDVTRPVLKVTRAADGTSNLDPILAGLSMMREPGAGGLPGGVTLAPELPVIAMDEATVAIDAALPRLPFGITLPGRATFEGGRITLRPTGPPAGEGIASTPVRAEVSFTSSTLDPGQGLSLSVEGTLAGALARVELRPARPVRFWLKERVVGVGGIALTADGVELGPLQLSVPLDRADLREVAAAASCEKVIVAPSAREVLARAGGLEAGADLHEVLARVLGALDRVTLIEPVIALSIDEAGRHDYLDLFPSSGAATVPEGAAPAEGMLVRALGEAGSQASERPRKRGGKAQEGRQDEVVAPLSARVARLFTALTERVSARVPALAGLLERRLVKTLTIERGEVLLAWPGAELTLAAVEAKATHAPERSSLEVSLALVDPRAARLSAPEPPRLSLDAEVAGERLHAELTATRAPLSLLGPVREPLRLGPEGDVEGVALRVDSDVKGASWEVSGKGALAGATFHHPAVAKSPLTGLALEAQGVVRWNGPEARFTLADGVLRSKGVSMNVSLDVADALKIPKVHLALDLPETPAQRLADALPRELVPMLAGARIEGTVRWPVTIDLDTADPSAIAIDSRPETRGLQVLSLGDKIDFNTLRTSHTYGILLADGTPGQRVVGPMTGSWVPLANITPYLPLALTTTEDGTFYSNSGISTLAIRESIATNLARGKFARGASTLTQQLVKNLYLGSDKTVSRKLQEIFLAWQLTQSLTKEEVMALYLNTIEFGPGLYGIGDAAWHWFGKRPLDLTLTEAVFLASIIPGPRRYYSFLQQGGVTPRWRGYLEALLKIMVERGKITQEELLAAAPYEPIFRGAGGGYTDAPPPEGFDAIPEGDELDAE